DPGRVTRGKAALLAEQPLPQPRRVLPALFRRHRLGGFPLESKEVGIAVRPLGAARRAPCRRVRTGFRRVIMLIQGWPGTLLHGLRRANGGCPPPTLIGPYRVCGGGSEGEDRRPVGR